jgi:membrane-anchored glycerophosphoryl diester phosphodiesterase (GDPDase)
MKFDGNRAWLDAVRAMSANGEVLLVMAGVFFFLPALVAAFFLVGPEADLQSAVNAMMAAPRNPVVMRQAMHAYGEIAPYVIVLLLVQSVGYMAMLALLTDQRRPTVGEAMASGVRCLPALIGAMLLFFLGYVLASLPLGLIVVGSMLVLGTQLGPAVGGTVDILVLIWAVTRLSLTLPVIVIEGLHNPVRALVRSWQITSGTTLRLISFYVLLAVAYLVIGFALWALVNLLSAATGTGEAVKVISGAVSGVIGAVTSIVLTAILAAVHRQLAGPSHEAISETFL